MIPFVEIKNLSVIFGHGAKAVEAVRKVSLTIHKGETLALVGESGSGKSVTALSILQLLPTPYARHPKGSIRIEGREVIGAPHGELQRLRGGRIAMIFQEPMTSLNPLHAIRKQIGETLALHKGLANKAAEARTLELLRLVQLKDPESRLDAYPHQLSGGERQRVMIAMALANEPDLLIADEPTTALDVTIQAQILKLLKELKEKLGMAMLLITHDLGIVRKMADRIAVMHEGRIVETEATERLFEAPKHAYTKMLLAAEPSGKPNHPDPSAPVVMTGEGVRVWFPIKKGLLRRTVDYVKAVDGISVSVSGRPHAWHRRRKRVRQDDACVSVAPPAEKRREDPTRRPRFEAASPARTAAASKGNADRLPGSLLEPKPAHVDRADHRGRASRS